MSAVPPLHAGANSRTGTFDRPGPLTTPAERQLVLGSRLRRPGVEVSRPPRPWSACLVAEVSRPLALTTLPRAACTPPTAGGHGSLLWPWAMHAGHVPAWRSRHCQSVRPPTSRPVPSHGCPGGLGGTRCRVRGGPILVGITSRCLPGHARALSCAQWTSDRPGNARRRPRDEREKNK